MKDIRIIHIHNGNSDSSTYIEYELNDKTTLLSMPHFISRYGENIINVYKTHIQSKACSSNGIRIMKIVA